MTKQSEWNERGQPGAPTMFSKTSYHTMLSMIQEGNMFYSGQCNIKNEPAEVTVIVFELYPKNPEFHFICG